MGRSLTVGRRRPTPTAAASAPASPPTAAADDAAVQEVFEDVLSLAAEPLVGEPGSPGAGFGPVGAPGNVHARVGEGRTRIVRQGITLDSGPSAGEIRERELAIMADSLAVVRDVTSALERGAAPAVAEREAHLEYAREQSREAFELARAIAGRETPAPTFHMHMPEHRVDVNVEGADIRLPAPEVHHHAGDTFVTVPEGPAPQVDVFVPAQEPTVVNVAAPAPEIHVTAAAPDVHVHAAAPSPTRGVRVEVDESGQKVYVPVEIAPAEPGE